MRRSSNACRVVLAVALCVGCKNHAREAEDRRELADEILGTARKFGNVMCACPDVACAQQTSARYDAWRQQAEGQIAELEQRQGKSVTAATHEINDAFAQYERCLIKFAIAR